jgi:hypothetical protein
METLQGQLCSQVYTCLNHFIQTKSEVLSPPFSSSLPSPLLLPNNGYVASMEIHCRRFSQPLSHRYSLSHLFTFYLFYFILFLGNSVHLKRRPIYVEDSSQDSILKTLVHASQDSISISQALVHSRIQVKRLVFS